MINKEKNARTSVTLPKDMYMLIGAIAQENNESISKTIQKIINSFIAECMIQIKIKNEKGEK